MVKHLLDQIMSPNTELKAEFKSIVNHTCKFFSKHPLTCLQWLQDSINLPTLHQAASESVIFMLLDVETVSEEEVDV